MPGIAEQPREEIEELLREVRYVRRSPTTASEESSSSGASTTLAKGRGAMSRGLRLGYENRLRGQGERGELRSRPTGRQGHPGEDQGYDPRGLTFCDEDWRLFLEDMVGKPRGRTGDGLWMTW